MKVLRYEDSLADITQPDELHGAKRWDSNYRRSKKGTVAIIARRASERAREIEVPCDVASDFLLELLEKDKCEITGIPFSYELGNNPFRPSLDRIDPAKGYTQENVRFVCVIVNYCLNEFGEDVFRQVCEAFCQR